MLMVGVWFGQNKPVMYLEPIFEELLKLETEGKLMYMIQMHAIPHNYYYHFFSGEKKIDLPSDSQDVVVQPTLVKGHVIGGWYGTQCNSMVNMAVLFVGNLVRHSILEEVLVGTFLCFRLMRKIQMVPIVRLPQSNNTQ